MNFLIPDKKTDNEIINDLKSIASYTGFTDPIKKIFENAVDLINSQKAEYDHLLKIARKMHTWIFLNTGDEQAAYDEIGLSAEDNILLGYMGEIELVNEEIK